MVLETTASSFILSVIAVIPSVYTYLYEPSPTRLHLVNSAQPRHPHDHPRYRLRDLHVSFFSFFVGGYVTTYPTTLEYQRVSPYLNGRDLAGEIFAAARSAGIKTLAMIDTGQLPAHAAQAHPDWTVLDAAGQPVASAEGIYLACPLGGYQRDYLRLMVAEILDRYQPDCMKFGGSSFGFPRRICYCQNCRASFRLDTGLELPPENDLSHIAWKSYNDWRHAQTRRRAVELKEIVSSINPDMPVMGNGVCFGDPHWTLNAGLDIEHIATQHDALQVEVQTRARYDHQSGAANWQWLAWPTETARFMTSISHKPIWVVASYFLAWPWRRSAVPAAEQKVYLAQVAANGAEPMVNLSGGPPAVHEDPRGFQAIRELYRFLELNQAYYQNDRSGANVAILYSLETLRSVAAANEAQEYVDELRGWQQALHEAHIPFDILSPDVLTPARLTQYRVIVLPSTACLSSSTQQLLVDYHTRGGGIVSSYRLADIEADGLATSNPVIWRALGIDFHEKVKSVIGISDNGYTQVYAQNSNPSTTPHLLLAGLEETWGMPIAGKYTLLSPQQDAVVLQTLAAPFIVFPEGLSYPTTQAPDDPLLVCREDGKARTVHFAWQVGVLAHRLHYPDHLTILANAVRWAAHGQLPIVVKAPPGLQISLRRQDNRDMVHLINLAGTRLFANPIPLHQITIELPLDAGRNPSRAFLLSSSQYLPLESEAGVVMIQIPKLIDYDVLVIEY